MINLYDVLEACNGQLFGEPAAHLFSAFCFDATCQDTAPLFVARRTDQGNTHSWIEQAIANGAVGVLCSIPPDCDTSGVTVIIVKDTDVALHAWARYIIQRRNLHVIAVAGTVGKTLTAEAIKQVLSARAPGLTITQAEGIFSLAIALANLHAEHQFLVVECSVHYAGEMAVWLDVIKPAAAVITNLRLGRLESFSGLEEIRSEHYTLVERLGKDGTAILNLDDEYTPTLRLAAHRPPITFGIDQFGADILAYNLVLGATKTGFDLRLRGERFLGRWIPWLGKHQVYAALAALAVGLHYDIAIEEGLRALTALPTLTGRMTPLNGLNNALLIDDSWNATPQSIQAALDWYQAVHDHAQREAGRLIFIMGSMDHLGQYSETAHRQAGQRAAEVAHTIITNGTEAAFAGVAALESGRDKQHIRMTYSVRDALTAVRDTGGLTEADTVIVTGGGRAHMERIAQGLLLNPADCQRLPRTSESPESIQFAPTLALSQVEIDLDALAGNVRSLKALIGDDVKLAAVVKSDAYGHGAVAVSRTALLNGASWLAVSSMYEALTLTEAGINAPLLVLNYTPVSAVRQAIRHNIALTVYDYDLAKAYEQTAREAGTRLRVHVKVDTGMGRLGIVSAQAVTLFRQLMNLQYLDIEGLYTHFAAADSDLAFTAQQAKTFRELVKLLRASGTQFKYLHAANSAGTFASLDYHFNMVRPGLALYGLSPSEQMPVPANFRPVLTWKTNVGQVKTLPSGHSVGYGRTYTTSGEERMAVLPVGYADGFRRTPVTPGEVLIRGQRAPIVGRVSMEKVTVNISHIPQVTVGDEVVLLGTQGGQSITADDIARRWGTINYEVVTSILARQPRR